MGIRKAFHHGGPGIPADPSRPHAFKTLGHHWVASGVPPASLAGSVEGAPAAIGTGFEFADRHCAVCRREASDPIHVPVD